MGHITVLRHEAVSVLNLHPDSVVIDCTLGSGGHAEEILSVLGPAGTYVGIDADPSALIGKETLADAYPASVSLVCENFRNLDTVVANLGLTRVDAILADLGWRSEQFTGEQGEDRGFSFNSEQPLHMTYGRPSDYSFTAHDIVNDWAEEDIANVIYAYGEERQSRRIARAIVTARKTVVIGTAKQLADIVASAVPRGRSKIHPATKTFQALRIAVNDEFDALQELIEKGFAALTPPGRLAIITFHSLEDRIVKHTFRSLVRDQRGSLVHKKPIAPTFEEIKNNPRARSAKLRTIEKQPL